VMAVGKPSRNEQRRANRWIMALSSPEDTLARCISLGRGNTTCRRCAAILDIEK
jgi:hypothetical protein